MSYVKFITCPRDQYGNTPNGKVIIDGIVVVEERISKDTKISNELCAVSRPTEVANKWPTFTINKDVVMLPPALKHLPVGFITAATYAKIWTWMWENDVYKCKYPSLNNTMPLHLECWTWYSRGKRICFYDDEKCEHYETGDELLDFDI